jgi:hypothetical protein
MDTKQSMVRRAWAAVMAVWAWMARLLKALFGAWDYEAPPWLQRLRRAVVANKGRSARYALLLAAVAGVGWWWWHRPQPYEPPKANFSFETPALTRYADTPPTVTPLNLSFDQSVAPLKALDGPARSITMTPKLDGEWKWLSDRELRFTPAGDWPVATHYTVRFSRKFTFAQQARLARYDFEFDTAPFELRVQSQQFYQDPIDPALKKAVFELSASHPIDAGTFESRVKLSMADNVGQALAAPGFVATYDEKRLQITLQSSALSLPDNGGSVSLAVEEGAQSLLGGAGQKDPLTASVGLPARFSLAVSNATSFIVDNAAGTPEQMLLIEMNQDVRDQDLADVLEARLLPRLHPESKRNRKHYGEYLPYGWSLDEVSEELLKQSQPLPLTLVAGERDVSAAHSFRFEVEPGRRLHLRLKAGLTSFGGFKSGKDYFGVVAAPDYPKLVRFVGDGTLLSLRGEQRVSLALRNVREVELTVARVPLDELHHLVQFNRSGMKSPKLGEMTADDLSERFRERIQVPEMAAGEVHYEGIDLSKHWSDSAKGVFLLSVREIASGESLGSRDPEQFEESYDYDYYEDDGESDSQLSDQRMVVLTDLGMIAKRSLDGGRDVYVQRLLDGSAAADARVSVIARNGSTLVEATADADGHAQLPDINGFRHEKQPVLLRAVSGSDATFLPLNDGARTLDYSRFDTGGEVDSGSGSALRAHLFSDRGMYRPGDTAHIGMIVRRADWSALAAGLPLRARVIDARGGAVKTQRYALDANGFMELEVAIGDVAPTGVWTVWLERIDEHPERETRYHLINQTSIRVKEFLPDRMKLTATLSSVSPRGWVHPDELSVQLKADNLIGTPAQHRRATGKMWLTPTVPSFDQYPGYVFFDQRNDNDAQELELGDQETDEQGQASFDLGLRNVSAPTFSMNLLTEVFEADGGRSVTTTLQSLVSRQPYLIGLRSIDSLGYVKRGAARSLDVLAIAGSGEPTPAEGLNGVVIERRYVSVLTRQSSGLYRYQSVLKELPVRAAPIALPKGQAAVALPTENPGNFVFFVRDRDGNTLNSMTYSVAGDGNVSRSLDRNAELALKLDKDEYRNGDEIEISIVAPYTGSGLITIERDRVYAHQWFKADTLASVQRIRVPAEVSGNAYVNVQFLRDPQSAEVFMSPLSYGAVPFNVDRAAHLQTLAVSAPARVKPGQDLPITLTTEGQATVAVFAIDEGILQVANYNLADPLDTFLAKKSLQVDTAQILDLMLPEFTQFLRAAAPGGDAEAALARNLNPFKRKADKPGVYWSGLTRVDGEHVFNFATPDSFNGKLRLMAVAVNDARIGIAQGEALVRGDFVLSPSLPTAVAPGDEFIVSTGVSFPPPDGDAQPASAALQVSASVGKGLELVDAKPQALTLAPGSEGTIAFRVRAVQQLGPQAITFTAASGDKRATRRVELSVRPLTPYLSSLQSGRVQGKDPTYGPLRKLWPDLMKRELAVAQTPLVLARGLNLWLGDFPHLCSEQLISKAIPGLIAREHPEIFASAPTDAEFNGLYQTLASRQNSAGGLGLWIATPEPDEFVSAYAGLFFIEASERGIAVPNDLVQANARYLATLAADLDTQELHELRARALAIYVLTRRGQVTTNYLAGLEDALDTSFADTWKKDVTATLIAATYAQMKQDKVAGERMQDVLARLRTPFTLENWWNGWYDDPAIQDALSMYLISRHFPKVMQALPPSAQERLVGPIEAGLNNTLSSAMTVLALAQIADSGAAADKLATIRLEALDGKDQATPFGTVEGWWKRGNFGVDANRVRIADVGDTPTWYALTDTGFDRAPALKAVMHGLELSRDYLGADGKPVTTMKQGDEIDVQLRLRTPDGASQYNVAVVELLPGGFELVEQTTSSEDEAVAVDVASRVALQGSDLALDYIDLREDRIVLYGTVHGDVRTFRYRLKATAAGTFAIPPLHATSMYDRRVDYIGSGGATITVERE